MMVQGWSDDFCSKDTGVIALSHLYGNCNFWKCDNMSAPVSFICCIRCESLCGSLPYSPPLLFTWKKIKLAQVSRTSLWQCGGVVVTMTTVLSGMEKRLPGHSGHHQQGCQVLCADRTQDDRPKRGGLTD